MSDRPRHVLHVLNGAAGGAALSTIGLIGGLRARGIESSAVCHDFGSPAERRQLEEATDGRVLFRPLYWWNRKIRLPAWKRPLSEVRQLLRTRWKRGSTAAVAEFARHQGADLIHSNTILTLEGALAGRQLGLPHVWHVRELVGPGHPYRLPYEGPALGQFLGAYADRVIANSEVTAAAIRSWLPAGLLEVVPNGIDLAGFTPRPPGDGGRPLVVGMVGNLTTRWKNHLALVRAAGLVDPALPIQWRIYGHDPSQGGTLDVDSYVNQLHEEIRRLNLADQFHLAGYHADPAAIMAQIDILAHPAESESFGRIIVEAMAAGLPVVGFAAGGVGEIVVNEQTGLLAPPGDIGTMARSIERLARDPQLRERFGAAGRLRAEQRYSLEASVEAVIRCYQSALDAIANRRRAAGRSEADRATSNKNPVSVSS